MNSLRSRANRRPVRRGFATLLVFAVVILCAVVIGTIQSTAFSQASAGRESLARVRAYWAARAGIESTLARLEFDTQNPLPNDAFQVMADMTDVAEGDLPGATWRIATTEGKKEVLGPSDAHSKININRASTDQLLAIEPLMTEDIADAIIDWYDEDEDARPLGAELSYYQTLPHRYQPRNAPFRSIQELELVAGVSQSDVRGEDWNLNGILDPNEDDGDASWPPDNADGILDRGWSGILTAVSRDGGLTSTGEKPIDLKTASENDIIGKTQVSSVQAKAILDYAQNGQNAAMTAFIRTDLGTLQQQATGQQQPPGQVTVRVQALTNDQLKALMDGFTIGAATGVQPGKLNINTCDAETLQYIPEIPPEIADAIIAERSARADGFTSVLDLRDVAGISRRQLSNLYDLLCVRSNVFVVNCRGRDERTGLEVEIQATLDRSTLPVVLREVIVR
ncbi:MAG: general secretion pathway protein GspK [Planctomycetes bacterium]|nr:general secretion pathway protein GspK [Planctomycetota bacterium]